MSTQHGETITLKPISEMAIYIKNLIPLNIPETYVLKPMFANIASEEHIRDGVIAFRDFMYLFCDRLFSDGHSYAKPPKSPKSMDDYPFIRHITDMLVDIGYHGKLAESGDSLLITELLSCAAPKPRITASSQKECLRFLALCGFVLTGSEVSYPNNLIMLTGLKALSTAYMELRERRWWGDFLRCDYWSLKAEETDVFDVLKDFLHPLTEKVQEFAFHLHQRHISMGMTCIRYMQTGIGFVYSYMKNSRKAITPRDIYASRIWEFNYSMKYGYCLFVRAKRTDKYADIIKQFPLSLQETILKGYGCDRKRNERCQGGCQGIRIPLDESILAISSEIETWLEHEVPGSASK